jgi:hypothetical protein
LVVAVQEKHWEKDYKVIANQTPEAACFVHRTIFDAQTLDHSIIQFDNNCIIV